MDIVKKMKNWDTWESLEKDLRPYLDDLYERGQNKDDYTIVQDYYILKLLSETKVLDEFFSKAIDQLHDSAAPYLEEYRAVLADIMTLYRYKDKLEHVVDAHPRLLPGEKRGICLDWYILFCEKQNAIKTKGGENLVMEDSKMEQYLKKKCDEFADITAKMQPNYTREKEICDLKTMIYGARNWVKCQKIFDQIEPKLHKEYEERIRNIWLEDNSCSTKVEKSHASSEDNSCSTQVKKSHASSEDNICSPKKPMLDEC